MTDAEYIEFVAQGHEQNEIWFRSQGMFEVAQYYQWAADRVRLRQPGPATKGCGGSSMLLLLDANFIHGSGDMTTEEIRAAADYLACRVEQHDAAEIRSLASTTRYLAGQVQAMIALWGATKGAARALHAGVETSKGPDY